MRREAAQGGALLGAVISARRIARVVPRALALAVCCGAALWTTRAHADAAPGHFRSDGYYLWNGGATVVMLGAALTAELALPDLPAGPDAWFFPGDATARDNHSVAARNWSQGTAWSALVVPVAGSLGRGLDERFANTELVYGEAIAVDTFLHSVVKFAVRRPRPYTYHLATGTPCHTRDCAVSFYSGHAATSFTAAMAGSYLFAESAKDRGSRTAMWAFEFTLASATANLRVRAGMHYYSDVLVGALVGSGVGLLVPVLHGGRYRPSGGELGAASGGVVLGSVISQMLPLEDENVRFALAPLPLRAGSGVQLRGVF